MVYNYPSNYNQFAGSDKKLILVSALFENSKSAERGMAILNRRVSNPTFCSVIVPEVHSGISRFKESLKISLLSWDKYALAADFIFLLALFSAFLFGLISLFAFILSGLIIVNFTLLIASEHSWIRNAHAALLELLAPRILLTVACHDDPKELNLLRVILSRAGASSISSSSLCISGKNQIILNTNVNGAGKFPSHYTF